MIGQSISQMKRNFNICRKCLDLQLANHDHGEEWICNANRILLTDDQRKLWNKEGWPTFEEKDIPDNCRMKLEYIVLYEKKSTDL